MSSQADSIDTRWFPSDYASARVGWLEAMRAVEAHYHSYPCAGLGPQGEALFTDTAWLGAEESQDVVVIIAGTHGIEAFAGSAVQLDLLHRWANVRLQPAENTACLLIHALTPWGYAWCRRCDADGVDLNRNAVDFSQPLPDNADYDRLRPFLFDGSAAERQASFRQFAELEGQLAFEKAISGGQYTDPRGPFYGGLGPSHGRRVCEDLIARYRLDQRRLAVIDLHTGLGPYGHGEIICDHAPQSSGAFTAQRLYGDAVTLPLAGTSCSVPKWGLLDYLWHRVMDDDSCYVTLEFGSYGTQALFDVLLDDHRLWMQATISDVERQIQAKAMTRHFCPEDVIWRELVLFRSRQVIAQAMAGVGA